MRFPERELEIARLAEDVARGLAANPAVFPAPSVTLEMLEQALAAYDTARDESMATRAAARDSTARKNEALTQLTVLVKATLRYAESLVNGDPGRLYRLGWAPRRKPTRNELVPPGQVMTLQVREEGEDWVILSWHAPFDGGPVSAYRVQRRRRRDGTWTDVGSAVETFDTLPHQETGVELEYRVIGVNLAGEGPASNIVRVVL